MGKVYRVEDKKAKEEIALKLIRPEVASDKKTIERFRKELTTAGKIRHKNICGIPHIREFISFPCEFKFLIMISEWNEKENNMLRYK